MRTKIAGTEIRGRLPRGRRFLELLRLLEKAQKLDVLSWGDDPEWKVWVKFRRCYFLVRTRAISREVARREVEKQLGAEAYVEEGGIS